MANMLECIIRTKGNGRTEREQKEKKSVGLSRILLF